MGNTISLIHQLNEKYRTIQESSKYNIGRYGIKGMEIHADNGKVLKSFNTNKTEDENWKDAFTWASQNEILIRDNSVQKRKG